jgi:hypothetical protein
VDALKKRRNSKELVITEILRAHDGRWLPSRIPSHSSRQLWRRTFVLPPTPAPFNAMS